MSTNTQITVPQLCRFHQQRLVRKLAIGPEGPWGTAIVIANILLFQAATENERVWQRCGTLENGRADESALSLVLAEIGCLACFQREKFSAVLRLMKQKGLNEAARISRVPPPNRAADERI